MDFLSLLRTVATLALLIGLLTGALWAVRRFDLKLPGRLIAGGNGPRRLELAERLPIDARRSVILVRKDGQDHLVLLAPEGVLLLNGGRAHVADEEQGDA